MQAVSGRTRESGKRPRLTSGLQGGRCQGRTVSIDSEVRTLDHLNDLRHAHPSAMPIVPRCLPFRQCCAPSVIPAEAGIHATAQPCDEPPSARRPTRAPSAPRVIARRRTLEVPLTPSDRMDSCLRRNDGQASVTEGRRSDGGGRSCATRYSGPVSRHGSPPLPSASPPASRGERGYGSFRCFLVAGHREWLRPCAVMSAAAASLRTTSWPLGSVVTVQNRGGRSPPAPRARAPSQENPHRAAAAPTRPPSVLAEEDQLPHVRRPETPRGSRLRA